MNIAFPQLYCRAGNLNKNEFQILLKNQCVPRKESHTLQCYCLLQRWKFIEFRCCKGVSTKVFNIIKGSYLAAQWFCSCLTFIFKLQPKQVSNMPIAIHVTVSFWRNKDQRTNENTLLSPVTTITRIPAVIHDSIAFRTSSLGGSSMPTYPKDVKVNVQ